MHACVCSSLTARTHGSAVERMCIFAAEEESEGVDSDSDVSSSDFHEIITSSSDEETIASSDEDDVNLLEAIHGSAFSSDPSQKKVQEMSLLQGTHFYFLTKTS